MNFESIKELLSILLVNEEQRKRETYHRSILVFIHYEFNFLQMRQSKLRFLEKNK